MEKSSREIFGDENTFNIDGVEFGFDPKTGKIIRTSKQVSSVLFAKAVVKAGLIVSHRKIFVGNGIRLDDVRGRGSNVNDVPRTPEPDRIYSGDRGVHVTGGEVHSDLVPPGTPTRGKHGR